jgi:hypothetical protein
MPGILDEDIYICRRPYAEILIHSGYHVAIAAGPR